MEILRKINSEINEVDNMECLLRINRYRKVDHNISPNMRNVFFFSYITFCL